MKKILYSIIVFTLAANISAVAITPKKPPAIKGMHYITIPETTLLQGILQSEISTKTNNLNDSVGVILPVNFYYVNTICIPQNSILNGSITEFELPKKGRDGFFKIHFDKIIFPSGKSNSFNADLWLDGSTLIGGKPSELDALRQVPFSVGGLSPGYILMKPTGEYKMGRHTTLCAGSEVLIKINQGIKLDFMN